MYIVGFGIGQLLIGPLSDHIGRKKVLCGSLILFCFLCLSATTSKTIQFLMLIRFFQGVSVSGQVLNVRAITADICHGEDLRRASIYITTAWTLSPIIAPMIGGYFQEYLGWQYSFYFLSIYSLLMLITLLILLPETNSIRPAFNMNKTIKNYTKILLDYTFMKNALSLAFAFSMINVFNTLAPYILQSELNYSPSTYGHYATLLGISCFIGSIANKFIMKRYTIETVIKRSLLLVITFSLGCMIVSHWVGLHVAIVILSSTVAIFFAGMLYPNYSANCSSMYKEMAGTAAAMRGFASMTCSAMIIFLISFVPNHSILLFISVYFVLGICMYFIFDNPMTRQRR